MNDITKNIQKRQSLTFSLYFLTGVYPVNYEKKLETRNKLEMRMFIPYFTKNITMVHARNVNVIQCLNHLKK